MSIFSKFYKYINDLMERRRIIKLCAKHLPIEAGEYKLYNPGRTYLVRKDVPASFLSIIGLNENCHDCQKITIKVEPYSDDGFIGQILMTTASGYRLFDYKNSLTYKQFTTPQEASKYKFAVDSFSSFFNVTPIKITEKYSVEVSVNAHPRKRWDDKSVLDNYIELANRYVSYLRSQDNSTRRSISQIFQSFYMSPQILIIYNLLKKDLDVNREFVTVNIHGDLHFGNTLYANDGIYLIDFDSYRNDFFYYDLFNIIYVDYVDKKDSTLLELYINGNTRVISCFKNLFSAIGDVFDEDKIIEYLKYYLLSRLLYDMEDAFQNHRGREQRYLVKLRLGKILETYNYITNKE